MNQKQTKSVEKPEETSPEEEVLLTSVRAKTWKEFSGQENVKESLRIAIEAAKKREEAMEHVLLYGPPGLGKTTLSHLIAREMGSTIRVTSGPAIERAGDLASILTNLEKGDILFIDEIHRLNKLVEETLYPAMEDYALDIIIGKGPSARTLRLDLPQFTIIGATTRVGLIAGPLRDRFGVVHRLNFYSPEELRVVITNAAKKLQAEIDDESIQEVAVRARGTPRIALKLLKRVRDYAQMMADGAISSTEVRKALDMFAIDTVGLDHSDRKLLEQLIQRHNGGPVGLTTIAATLSEDTITIEEVLGPYLLQIGFIRRTPRGRVVTRTAYIHLGVTYTKQDDAI